MNALIVNLNLAVDKTLLVPSFEKGNIYRVADTITLPGGKGVNVARALRVLGLEAPVAGFASGHNGRWIAEALKKEGFTVFVERHGGGESRVCYTIVDSKGRSTDINEEGPDVPAASQDRFLKKFSAMAGGFRVAAYFALHSRRSLKTLIVTDGPGHTYAVSPFGLWSVKPPRLPGLKSPTGAGDSFMAGFLFGFLHGYDFERTLKLASGAAASDCLTLGAGLVRRDQAMALAQRTLVKKIH